jgi:hypothetical protein
MIFSISLTKAAIEQLTLIKNDAGLTKRYKAVIKTLQLIKTNPRHPVLQTHQFHSLAGPAGEKVFEAYVEQNTPAAYRIFFYYGKVRSEIIVFAITEHP